MLRHPIYHLITGFAGQGVVLPILLVVAAILVLSGQRRAALWWTVSILVALVLTLVAKIGFIPCGRYVPSLGLRSPSGHAASAMAIYGGLAVLFMRIAPGRWPKIAVLAAGLMLAIAVAVSRVVLGAHSAPEAWLGGAIGLFAPLILASRRDLLTPSFRFRWIWLLAVPILLVILLHNIEIDAERDIDGLARSLAALTGICR